MRVFIDITKSLIAKSLKACKANPNAYCEHCIISQAVKKHFKEYIITTGLEIVGVKDADTKQTVYKATLSKILKNKMIDFDLGRKVEPGKHVLTFRPAKK